MASGSQNMTTYKARYLAGGTAIAQEHLKITGTIYFGANTSVTNGKPILAYDANNLVYGIRYFEGDPDVFTFSASGNGDNKTNADLSINGLGNGILSHKGNYIPHTGNTTGSVGGAEQPVYVNSGTISSTSYALKATVNNGTATYLAYYSGARAISSWAYAKFHDGCLSLFPTTGGFRDGMRIHCDNGPWSVIMLCGPDNTGDSGTSAKSYLVGNWDGNFYITKNGADNGTAYLRCVNNVWAWNGTATGNISGSAGSISPAGNAAQFWRGDNRWSDTFEGDAPYLTVKSNNTSYYAVFRLATQSNGEAAVLFLNNTSRSGDGGANTLTLRNNVGNLRLNNNTYNTGTFTVGDSAQTNYKFQVSGTSYLDGSTYTRCLILRRSESESYGRICFYNSGYVTWYLYMAPAGAASPTSKGSASYGGVSSWAIRCLIEDAANYGWVWESCSNSTNSTPDGKMALRADTGELTVKSHIYANGSNRVLYTSYGTIAGFRNQAGSNQAYYWGFNGGSNETYAVPNSSMSVGNATRATTAGSVDRATFGNSSNAEHNANNIVSNGMWYYTSNGPSGLGEQSTDGSLYSQAYSTDWVTQIAADYRTGKLYVRSKKNGTWQSWLKTWYKGESITSAVWNDYAEYRNSDCIDPGRVVIERGDDSVIVSQKRLSHFAGVVSDTWGFAQGKTELAKVPIAVAGRVLVYPYKPRNLYKPGDCVCAAPNGTVDIMTHEEIIQYPDRIVGTVSCVPDYEEWGGGEGADRDPVKVNGRIWIKVK